ncbi:MAG TPA: 23S rRNA (guanosine(2251)-2'-O)-methyltransferase RlmB [Thermomicrobiales bacterium]|nr:23S rRNA (guanosine(2251)-2'-O)-methyltransferase RlmB [Thermomicrobiales bacterium]
MSPISARGSSGPSRPPRKPQRDQGRPDRSREETPGKGGSRRTSSSGDGPNRGPRPDASGPRPGKPGPRPGGKDGGPRDRRRRAAPFTIRGEALYGRNAVLEALRAQKRTSTRLWVAEGLREDPRVDEIVRLAREAEVLVETVPRTMLDDQEPEVNHQGVILETSEYAFADLADVVDDEGNVLVLDHLQDPQNVGTLLRAADAAGVAGVIIPTDRAATITPAVVNSSAGAVEHLAIASVPNLGNALDKLEASGRWIIGLDGGPNSQDLFSTDIPTPAVLVVGSEGPGLTANIRKRCQLIVSLPMRGQVESLNAATAGSIALFDLVRRDG